MGAQLFRPIPPIKFNNGEIPITSLTLNQSYHGHTEIEFSLAADGESAFAFYNLLRDSMNSRTSFPFGMNRLMDSEFMCIWCGSVNPITNRHCSQCGGPRGLILSN